MISRFHTQHAAGALAYLAYYLGQPQPREVLVELLWPGVAPTKGRDRLNVAISSLRRQLEPADGPRGCVVWGDRHQVKLSSELVTTDVQQFRAAVAAARTATAPEQARPLLEAALGLYAGPLLPGHYQTWIGPEQELLNDLLIDAAQRLVAIEIAQQRPQAALAVAQRAVAADPLREDCHALVLRAAAAMGDAALARRHYDSVVQLFDRELGCKPSSALAHLVRAADGVADRAKAAPVSVPAEPLGNATGNTTYLGIEGQPRQSVRELAQAYRGSVATADGAVLAFGAASDAWHCADMLLPEAVTLGLVTLDVGDAADAARAIFLARRAAAAGHAQLVLADQGTVALLREGGDGELRISEQGRYRLAPGQPPELLHWLSRQRRAGHAYPPPRAEAAAEAHVPPTLSACFGRDADITAVDALLADAPCVVTITGPGGAGKTRLAIEVARLWTRARARTSWFVPLAALRDAELLPRAILGELRGGRLDDSDPMSHVVYLLTREPSLLVLDNFEQLPDEATGVVAELAARVPHLCCLVTSRRTLGLAGEREYPLPLLVTPAVTGEADLARTSRVPSVAMFVDRARAALPTFRLDEHNHRAVAELVARLEGWPLAIELAAPMVQGAPVSALVERFGEHLDWRATRRSALPARQRTMRATLDWSISLLPEPAKRFLRLLSVFGGWFTVAEAAEVAAEPLAELYIGHLRGCSLVERTSTGGDAATTAYVLRPPVRELVGQLASADELGEARERHARHFGALADEIPAIGLSPRELGSWLDHIEVRLPEVRLALDWGLANEPRWALSLAHALVPLWELRGHADEGMRLFERLRGACGELPPDEAGQLAYSLGRLACLTRPHREVVPILDQAIATFAATNHAPGLIGALFYQMVNHLVLGDVARLTACAALCESVVDSTGALPARILLHDLRASIGMVRQRFDEAQAEIGEAVALARQVGDPISLIIQRTQQALLMMATGRNEQAEAIAEELAEATEGQVQGYWAARICFLRARLACARGDLVTAADCLYQAAPVVAGQASIFGYEWAMTAAEVAARVGQLRRAVECSEMTRRWRAEYGSYLVLPYYGRAMALVDALITQGLDRSAIRSAVQRGRTASMAKLAAILEELPAAARSWQAQEGSPCAAR